MCGADLSDVDDDLDKDDLDKGERRQENGDSMKAKRMSANKKGLLEKMETGLGQIADLSKKKVDDLVLTPA